MSMFSSFLKNLWNGIKHFFDAEVPAVTALVSKIMSDEVQAVWPQILSSAEDIIAQKTTILAAAEAIAKTAASVAEKDVADALGVQVRYLQDQAAK